MTRTDEFIGLLEDYLDMHEGPTPMPDALRDAIHAELPTTRQIRPLPGMRRMPHMISTVPRPARFGLVAAFAVVIALLGFGLLRGPSHVGGPSAAPTPTPTAAPTPAGPASLRGSASNPSVNGAAYPPNLPPGIYYLDTGYPAKVTVDVPPGWFLWDAATDYNGVLVDSPDAPAGSGWGLVISVIGHVSKDACNQYLGVLDTQTQASVDTVVSAMGSWAGFEITESSAITVDGFAGRMITVRSTLNHSGCPTPKLWTAAESGYWEDGYALVGDQRHPMTYRLLQVGQSVLVIRTTDFPETSPFELEQGVPESTDRHAVDQLQLQAMVDSIRISVPRG